MDWLQTLKTVFSLALIYSTLRAGISIIFAGMGEMINERAGVLNIGIEGIMIMGALAASLGSYFSGNPWIGLLLAALTGILIGLIFAFIAITLKSVQAIAGLAIFLLAAGLSGFILQVIFKHGGNSPMAPTLPMIKSEFLAGIPILGPIFNNQSILVIPALLLPIVIWLFLYRTPWGTWLRAAGENPQALAVVGIDPIKVRYLATLAGAMLHGIGGAYLSISQTSIFSENMVAGRGFIALAAVIFGNAKPRTVFFACLFFAFMDALQISLQTTVPDTVLPREIFMALPYVLTLLILGIFAKRTGGAADIGNPYHKEAR
jgi:general nucleoside transport system permease protein